MPNSPENNNNRTLTTSDNHQSFPDHQRRGNNHTKVQHLIVELQTKFGGKKNLSYNLLKYKPVSIISENYPNY